MVSDDAGLGGITPDWPVPAGVRAWCSARSGGVSTGAFDSLNLGDHVGDAADAVALNRQRLAAQLQAGPVFLKQVHGWDVVDLVPGMADGLEADASTSVALRLACTVMVADCLPVLLARADGSQVGAAHAGWRGLLGQGGAGVLEAVCARLRADAPGSELMAWLGPCIGPQAFEVGAEVFAAFVGADAASAGHFQALASAGPPKYLADLAGLARQRLAQAGVKRIYGNDSSAAWCTVNNPSRFFSHRRDRGRSGRFAASIWRV